MKLKDYVIPQYGLDDGLNQGGLDPYDLKNFDLKAYQLAQQPPDPAPAPGAYDGFLLGQETVRPTPLAVVPEAPAPAALALEPAPPAVNPFAVDPRDVHFGPHFNLQTVTYNPLSPAQPWKMPRWVVTMVGLFFGSAAVLTVAVCVALLRGPSAAPAEPSAAAAAPVATTVAEAAPRSASSLTPAPAVVTHAATAPLQDTATRRGLADRAAVRHGGPAMANLLHDDSALARRVVVSRHRRVVRRQGYGSRHVAAGRASASEAAPETETASSQRPKDALDQLLSESSL